MNSNSDFSQNRKIYPTPNATRENRKLARMLMSPYAGEQGELTAICTYMYQSTVLSSSHPDISETLDHIAMDEMNHFRLLSRVIRSLGVKPRILVPGARRRNLWWNSEFVNDTCTLENILENDIREERTAMEEYYALLRWIDDPTVCALIKAIIEDEKQHLRILSDLLTVCNSQK